MYKEPFYFILMDDGFNMEGFIMSWIIGRDIFSRKNEVMLCDKVTYQGLKLWGINVINWECGIWVELFQGFSCEQGRS